MTDWMVRMAGLASLILGGLLFVVAVKHVTAEWPQIFVGLLSVFFSAVGFGILIMPLEPSDTDTSGDGRPKV